MSELQTYCNIDTKQIWPEQNPTHPSRTIPKPTKPNPTFPNQTESFR